MQTQEITSVSEMDANSAIHISNYRDSINENPLPDNNTPSWFGENENEVECEDMCL